MAAQQFFNEAIGREESNKLVQAMKDQISDLLGKSDRLHGAHKTLEGKQSTQEQSNQKHQQHLNELQSLHSGMEHSLKTDLNV